MKLTPLVRCFYHEGYYFPLPAEHPFPMDKFWRAEALIRAARPSTISINPVEPAPFEKLLRVHTPEYLEKIRTGALDHLAALKLGLPAGEALLARSRLEVAGTLAAVDAALTDGLACNLAGGTHHAFPDRGEGYCVLNDVAIAIRDLHVTRPALRVFVLDTDAHQGNGTHALFADDLRVFTYSIHVGKNYPALKVPGALDVELPRYVSGADYLEALESTLVPALNEFAPELVIWIAGADPHEHDRFGQMKLADGDLAARDHHILRLVTSARMPTAILYGGGYNRDREHTARIHAATVLRAATFFHAKQ
ncbi:MAG: histone deacetylase [Undibacterium sp.]|nr:histone deacetylase [Opitutaceae bacterium]